jgi:RimJ/RimL family protein N-acetyltransferase
LIPLLIRPVSRSDRAVLTFSLHHLGARSLHQRFFTAHPGTALRDVNRMVAADHWHQETLIAFVPAPRTPVGVAEYVRLNEFDLAEVAIAVVDQWQRRGVGQALLEALRVRALAAGVRHFEATMLRDNKGALALARHIGVCSTHGARQSLVELVLDLER